MSLLTPDTSMIGPFEERGKFIMAWRLSILFLLVFTTLAFAFGPVSIQSAMVYALVVLLAVGILIYLYLTKKSKIPYWIYAISGSIIAQITLNTILDSAHFGDFIWIVSTIIFAFVGLGRIPGLFFTIFNLLGLGYYIAFSLNPHFEQVRYYTTPHKIALFLEMTLGFVTVAYLLSQYLVFQSYSQKQLQQLNVSLEEQNDIILSKNKENITLVKEVHHRVKNNLQIIISLLRMQRSEIQSDEAKEQFNVAINRILTMSMIHQKLYQEKEPSKINIKDYLEDLIGELVSLSGDQTHVNVQFDASEEYADLKTIVPFGLLVNELVANSIKHAFKNNNGHEITISLSSLDSGKKLQFKYSDNGTWQEPDDSETGFGLELIEILTEQLEGVCDRQLSSYTFMIPVEA